MILEAEPLLIDGLTYVPITDAAAAAHLSTEYLARLARQHRLRARMVAHMWFIETHSLQRYLSARPTKQRANVTFDAATWVRKREA
jgi:hypothetical protein